MARNKPCECCESDMLITRDGRNGHQLAIEIYPDNHLMGITSFAKDASKVNSDSQLYKQAGNSIVVNCLYLIFKEMK